MPANSLHISSLATLPQETQQKILAELSQEQAEALLHDWEFFARPEQLPPPGEWSTWLVMAGRGFGKTRCGAEWVRARIKAGYGRIALVAPTAADARDVMVEGESGLAAVCWEHDRDHKGNVIGRPLYEPSKRKLTWANGATAHTYSAEEPDRLRGPQHDSAWCDETAAWKAPDTWDMLLFGLRLGLDPRIIATTTPKPVRLVREVAKDPGTVITRGSTFDNAANLAPRALEAFRRTYEGTRLGKQELYAELLEEAEGALWTRALIEAACTRPTPPAAEMQRIVIAVDPAVTAKAESDETGIVAAGVDAKRDGHVLRDISGRYSPEQWARRTVLLFDELKADRVVVEDNQGGDMVESVLRQVSPALPIKRVHAHTGKAVRAEPVAALYEQRRVSHAPGLSDLEDQMCIWEPLSGQKSPDRLDALVYALRELMLGSQSDGPRIGRL
ncbi:DNA-packaging protein [Pyruvatibacter mobilis]|uniref:DNA-packaging protein n=1 Tax=Pyruvatibacter mobilis TaxID=1712261 RepID=UPI003BAEFB0F